MCIRDRHIPVESADICGTHAVQPANNGKCFACVAVEKRDDRIYFPACVRFDAGHAPEGLRPGDVVVEWDGEPVGGMRIDSAVTAPGRHRMAALRGGVRTEYTFETKEIL